MPPQGIPFDACLVFPLGYKFSVLVSSLDLQTGPQFADISLRPIKLSLICIIESKPFFIQIVQLKYQSLQRKYSTVLDYIWALNDLWVIH